MNRQKNSSKLYHKGWQTPKCMKGLDLIRHPVEGATTAYHLVTAGLVQLRIMLCEGGKAFLFPQHGDPLHFAYEQLNLTHLRTVISAEGRTDLGVAALRSVVHFFDLWSIPAQSQIELNSAHKPRTISPPQPWTSTPNKPMAPIPERDASTRDFLPFPTRSLPFFLAGLRHALTEFLARILLQPPDVGQSVLVLGRLFPYDRWIRHEAEGAAFADAGQ